MPFSRPHAIALLLSLAFAGPAAAVGTLVPADSRVDLAHDDKRGLIYVSEPTRILRYNVATGTFLSPITFGTSLGGIDISPDGNYLAVADRDSTATEVWVWVVTLDTGAVRKIPIPRVDSSENGTWTAVYDHNGKIYTSSTFAGSGWVPFRRVDPVTDIAVDLATTTQWTMLAPSGDRRTISFAEANISDGRWGLYDVPTGGIVRREWYENGTSWYNFEIGTDRFGAQFAIPTYGGTMVYDDLYAKVATIGTYAGEQPIGVAYHPVERIAYFPFAQTSQVRVYDMNTFAPIGNYDFEYTFSHTGNYAFGQGRTKLSRDGSILMSSVDGGVRFVQMYAPLAAAPISTSTLVGKSVSIPLQGSIGNGGTIAYSVASAPSKGKVTISGSNATYTPPARFSGTATFSYRASYGLASKDAVVTVAVGSGGGGNTNHSPVAVNDSASTSGTAISIPVLANDTDSDGDSLLVSTVTQPATGRASILNNKVRFVPGTGWTGPSVFNYTVSDKKGGTATATVTVTKTAARSTR